MIPDDEIERFAYTPQYALYRAIDRFFALRVSGRGAAEALHAVTACIDSIQDKDYKADVKRILSNAGTDYEWDMIRAVLSLLKRNNLWLNPPRALVRGEELLGAVK